VSTATLIAYWLRELDGAEDAALDEHLFACTECSARLAELVRLADGVQRAARAGTLFTIVSARFIQHLTDAGLHVRRYDAKPGGSVNCTVTPEDDAVVAYLEAPLEGIERLDLLLHDLPQDAHYRVEDIPFDPAAGEVVVAPSLVQLRKLGKARQIMRLVAVKGGSDQVIGEYTFNHSPTLRGAR
jgi:hypothetical protein